MSQPDLEREPDPTGGETLSFPSGSEPELHTDVQSGEPPLILVLGATGYVGGRLVPRLLTAGYRVRLLSRSNDRIKEIPWASRVDIRVGDAANADAVELAAQGVDTLYYLVHSMTAGKDFARADRRIAQSVARAAKTAGVRRIVYLGGLHPRQAQLSEHLASRVEVADILLASGVPTIVLQAGVIIGSGSASFEMVRHLTEVLPYMPAPKWVRNFIQPIAIRDVLYYLLASVRTEYGLNRAFDIGGPDVLRYGQMMNGYALEAGLQQRHIASLPVLTPRLASHWVGLVTPVPRQIARPLVESLQHDCVMLHHDIDEWIPHPKGGLTPYRDSVKFALGRIKGDVIETSWVDARVPKAPSDPLPSDPDWSGRTVFTDQRSRNSRASTQAVWTVISSIGGDQGWHSSHFLWSLRGLIDRIQGGVGMKRGRRSRGRLRVGDAIDVWRVEEVIPQKRLRLRAEMRVPGQAWLELGVEKDVDEAGHGGSRYWQRATFVPHGLKGRLYWLTMLPFHGLIFRSMTRSIVRQAEQLKSG